MNILFLDVEGVLNSSKYLSKKYEEKGRITLTREEFFDPECMKILKVIVDLYDFYVVITSSWKIAEYHILKNVFGKYGITIYDRTKNYGDMRGQEIIEWLDNHKNEVKNYVILDDDIFKDYEATGVLSHLVKTSFMAEHALESKHIYEIEKILKETKF